MARSRAVPLYRIVDSNVLLTVLAPVFWGSTYVVTTQMLPPHLPLMAALIRVLPPGIVLTLYAKRLPEKKIWGKMLLLSFLNIGCFQVLLFTAAYRLPGGIAAVIGALQTLVVMALIWQCDRMVPSKTTLLATLGSIIGLAMLLITPSSHFDGWGLLAAFGGAVSMGSGIFLTKRWRPTVPNLTFTGWQLLFGGLMLWPIASYFEHLPAQLSVVNVIGYAYLGVFGSLIAYSLWFRGIGKLPPVAVSILGTFSPITATIIGWVYLHQTLTPLQSTGFVLVLLCVIIVQYTSKKEAL